MTSNGKRTSAQRIYNSIFIYELPSDTIRELCDHCDMLDLWMQLAQQMEFSALKIQEMQRRIGQPGSSASPTEELLAVWGSQYNHKVHELFFILYKLKVYQGMRIIKDYVPKELHLCIPSSKPAFSEIENKNSSIKKINTPPSTYDSTTTVSTNDSSSSAVSAGGGGGGGGVNGGEEGGTKENGIMNEIDYETLTKATNNWDKNLQIGRGGFGVVYKGHWSNIDVAIKQINYERGPTSDGNSKIQLQQSLNELKCLYSFRHDFILPLYGYSLKGEKPCLVYQLMKGGTLEKRLNPKDKADLLTWKQRIYIIYGTACGIDHLHSCRKSGPLIHGDIKPANILLDQCLTPKIGDFGLARDGPNESDSSVQLSQVFGTKPYLPPEFLNSKRFSTKVDIYSFGIVVLETFTGLKVLDKTRPQQLLGEYILALTSSPNFSLEQLIDRHMLQSLQPAEKEICMDCIDLGIGCIAPNPEDRLTMDNILNRLIKYKKQLNF